ncbi:MAG TPA: ABC transporter ATP-binding protein [Flavobacterium sp.]|nr:ABC transporter ATP-binding protein [Flavobacterium sp.]
MKKLVIQAKNISKQYRLGEVGTGTLSHDLNRFWAKMRGKEDPYLKIGESNDRSQKGSSDYVWSLKDINFEIEQGDAVGIIGRNGAGKSTLLKLLSKVTRPTTGSFKVNGRIASLLEVGTGFNPEMTGRENIYLNGAILGMRKHEINRKFDEIVDFSGVERYIDTPVKRYSSGMYVRLAFAVAAHLESEILIVDEVLAVGDAEFQKKCLGKMGDVSKGEGRTVLFVSHNMAAVKNLCNRGIILENGMIKHISANIEDAVNNYFMKDNTDTGLCKKFNDYSDEYGNNIVRLNSVEIIVGNGSNFITIKDKISIVIYFEIFNDISDFNLAINFKSLTDDAIIFSLITDVSNRKKGSYKSILDIPDNFLNSKFYTFNLYFVTNNKSMLTLDNILNFEVVDLRENINYYGTWSGYVRPKLNFTIK